MFAALQIVAPNLKGFNNGLKLIVVSLILRFSLINMLLALELRKLAFFKPQILDNFDVFETWTKFRVLIPVEYHHQQLHCC